MPKPEGGGVPEPWDSFFNELDSALNEDVELYCLGGFVISMKYGLTQQPTNDVDFVEIVPHDAPGVVEDLAGQGSALHRKHRVYLHRVGIATVPEN